MINLIFKHFVGGKGPTEMFPDPLPADGSQNTPSRPPPRKRQKVEETEGQKVEETEETKSKFVTF